MSRLVKGPAYGQILQGSRVEYSSSCFSIADVFGRTKPSIEFSGLHPSQSSTRAAWRRRVATRSRPASPASYRTELRDLAAAGRRVTACIEEKLDRGAAGQHSRTMIAGLFCRAEPIISRDLASAVMRLGAIDCLLQSSPLGQFPPEMHGVIAPTPDRVQYRLWGIGYSGWQKVLATCQLSERTSKSGALAIRRPSAIHSREHTVDGQPCCLIVTEERQGNTTDFARYARRIYSPGGASAHSTERAISAVVEVTSDSRVNRNSKRDYLSVAVRARSRRSSSSWPLAVGGRPRTSTKHKAPSPGTSRGQTSTQVYSLMLAMRSPASSRAHAGTLYSVPVEFFSRAWNWRRRRLAFAMLCSLAV
ncbi:hypothetical protein BGZ61DRAFT_576538 [Ilyonectria robusta]|uniref:uncharacterized protein n=1 Tax=Ilyonectria robusta TaxID=1079257 RepID=UPI001E8DE70D|nr:uncharacterized protein BGZ61DRAFT_576538 [Ilyonectria robusta]KAH8651758.1 hypothetical protein BGZ61DRAFT_576538 [Ilyonectria robusta]